MTRAVKMTVCILALYAFQAFARGQASFEFDVDGPDTIGGAPGASVTFIARARIVTNGLEAGVRGAQGWSMSLASTACTILQATTDGTSAAVVPAGRRDPGVSFEKIELTTGPGNEGVTVAEVLSLLNPNTFTLDPGDSPDNVLVMTVQATIPTAADCGECSLAFRHGLVGEGQPVQNQVTYEGVSLTPALGSKAFSLCLSACYRREPLEVSGVPAAVDLVLTPSERTACLTLRAAEAGKPLILTLTDPEASNRNALYVNWGQEPSPTRFALAAAGPRASQTLVVPFPTTDDCFVLVRSRSIAGGAPDARVTFTAVQQQLVINAVAPPRGTEGGSAVLTIRGGGFVSGVTGFELVHAASGAAIAADRADIPSTRRADVTFTLSGPTGLYHLDAFGPGRVPLVRAENRFEVVAEEIVGLPEVTISGFERYRPMTLSRLTVTCTNVGDGPLAPLLLKVTAPANVLLRPERQGQFLGSEILLNAVNPAGPAGSFSPGDSVTIPVIFTTTDAEGEPLTFEVHVLTANEGQLIGAPPPPPGVPGDGTWPSLLAAFKANDGDTWQQYGARMGTRGAKLLRRGRQGFSTLESFNDALQDAHGRPNGAILGTLRRAGNLNPLTGVTVVAFDGVDASGCDVTDALGTFAIECLDPSKTHRIEAVGHATGGVLVDFPVTGDALGVELTATAAPGNISPSCSACDQSGLATGPLFPPPALFSRIGQWEMTSVTSIDPNEKEGPDGVDGPAGERFISVGETLQYLVFFENLPTATAPAQKVVVVDELDPDLDWSTFEVGEIRFADQVVSLDTEGDDRFSGFSNTAEGGQLSGGAQRGVEHEWEGQEWNLVVDAAVDLDLFTGTVTWTFQTLDPTTLQPSFNPDAGFLLPNDETHRGEGYVAYSIQPLPTLGEGDVIDNDASIKFDTNEDIVTNTWTNEISDMLPPAPPRNPAPDGASLVDTDSFLCWQRSARTDTYEVFLWKEVDGKPAAATVSGLTAACFEPPGVLEEATRYFWQVVAVNIFDRSESDVWSFTTVGIRFKRADADASGGVNLTDAVATFRHLFVAGAMPLSCLDAADSNDSGNLNLTDGVYTLQYLFQPARPAPPPPFDDCGIDPEIDALDCDSFPPCRP